MAWGVWGCGGASLGGKAELLVDEAVMVVSGARVVGFCEGSEGSWWGPLITVILQPGRSGEAARQ